MTLQTFLAACQKNILHEKGHVFYLQHTQHPVLFSSLLCQRLKEVSSQFVVQQVTTDTFLQCKQMLSTSFLGQFQIVWLGALSGLSEKLKKELLHFLEQYKGPHTIICTVTSKETVKAVTCIDLAVPLDKTIVESIYSFFWQKASFSNVQSLIATNYKKLSLEQFLLLSYYSLVLGKDTDEFMRSWYPQLIQSDESLFALSQSFFSKKQAIFFRQWLLLKDRYAFPFWISFWSEQLWRASHVVDYQHKQDFIKAKQIGFRLPFSFIQKEWKQYTTQEFYKAHTFLYGLDRSYKTGGSDETLDCFYSKFFTGSFK